jgi:hypothetical protein
MALFLLDLRASVPEKGTFSLDAYVRSFWVKTGRYPAIKSPISVFTGQCRGLTRFSVPLLLRPL